MKKQFRLTMRALLAIGVFVAGAGTVVAQTSGGMEKCNDPRVDRTACLREMAAAQDAEQRGKLNSPGGYEQNALARCKRQPTEARAACEKRVMGTGNTTVQGSVQGGGKIRTNEMPAAAPSK